MVPQSVNLRRSIAARNVGQKAFVPERDTKRKEALYHTETMAKIVAIFVDS
jgi:hypothetical protein